MLPAAKADSPPTAQYTAQAHTALGDALRDQLLPHLRAYASQGGELAERLDFVTTVLQIQGTLKALRTSAWTQALQRWLPGTRWALSLYDTLNDLLDRLNTARVRLGALQTAAQALQLVAQRYIDAPDTPRLLTLLAAYRARRSTFEAARNTFHDLALLAQRVLPILQSSADLAHRGADLPLIGGTLNTLGTSLQRLTLAAQLAVVLLDLTQENLAEDGATLRNMARRFDRAQAHDAYAHATRLAQRGQLGFALQLYIRVRYTWPDSPWAQRARRRADRLVRRLDRLAARHRSTRGALSGCPKAHRNPPGPEPPPSRRLLWWLLPLAALAGAAATATGRSLRSTRLR